MEMSHVRNPQVIAALEHVRTFRPEVTQVFYTNELKWLYMTDDGDAPAFGGEIDTSLLEDAVDSLDTFPAAFHITSPVRPADAPDNLTLRALVKAELFMSGFEGDEVQEGVDADLASIRQAIQQCQDQAKRGVTVSVSVKGGMITDAAASLPGFAWWSPTSMLKTLWPLLNCRHCEMSSPLPCH
jgi:hypothetical protein